MTCADVRHRLLTADLSVLRGESDHDVAEHLASCPTCAAAAARIVGQTNRLAATLGGRHRESAPRVVRRRSAAWVAVPVAAAAGIALIALLTHRAGAPAERTVHPVDSLETEAVRVSASVTRDSARRDPPSGIRPIRPVRTAERQTSVEPARPTETQPSGGVASASTDSVSIDRSFSQVGVRVESNQRAVVLATSNPKITVVWLYPGSGK